MDKDIYADISDTLRLSRQDPDFKDDFDKMLADSESETDEFERRHFSPNMDISGGGEGSSSSSVRVQPPPSRQSRQLDEDEAAIFSEGREGVSTRGFLFPSC